jgi:hypothetical protein
MANPTGQDRAGMDIWRVLFPELIFVLRRMCDGRPHPLIGANPNGSECSSTPHFGSNDIQELTP